MSKFATTLDPETVEAVLLHVDTPYYDERDESKRIYDLMLTYDFSDDDDFQETREALASQEGRVSALASLRRDLEKLLDALQVVRDF